MGIGDRIADARKRQNLTQEQLAQLLSVSRQAISRWESEQAYPETERIVSLSEILDVNCDYLLRGSASTTDQIRKQKKNVITRLLNEAVGKCIKITFYSDTFEFELADKKCMIKAFDGNWANVEYKVRKGVRTKLISVFSILSITFMDEGE